MSSLLQKYSIFLVDPISSYSVMKHSMPFIVTVLKNDLSG